MTREKTGIHDERQEGHTCALPASPDVNLSGTDQPVGFWPLSTWLSVISLTFGSFALISSELLPMAVLTPMAADLGVTEGAAGQAVTLTAIFAGIAAPTVALIIGRVDRKLINLLLCALVVASNIAVALTSDFLVLLAARTLLGVAIGGFFALAGATVVRLVTMEDMGKGMSIVFMGLSAGLVVAPATSTLIGEAFGWRAAFVAAAGAGLLALLLQAICLPSVPSTSATSLSSLFGLLKRRHVRVGLVVGLLFFGGEVCGFTFMRPYLETHAGLGATSIAPVLLVLGLASLLGSAIAGVFADRMLRDGFASTFLVLGIATIGLLTLSTSYVALLAFAAAWGIAIGAGPVMTQTWMGRAAPDQLEGVGGLFLAVIQFGITLGAIAGGIAMDVVGTSAPLYVTATCAILAALLIATQRAPEVEQPTSALALKPAE
jgi:DHA1 family purine ribonucleoside efflux pump-like MFS transporter